MPVVYIADLLFLAVPIAYLIYIIKQKSKKLADYKWNLKNHRFYIYDNKLGEEDAKGTLSLIFLIGKIVTFILFFISFLPYFNNSNSDLAIALPMSNFLMGCYIFSVHFILVGSKEYWYFSYIFEKEDSYVIRKKGTWEKHKK